MYKISTVAVFFFATYALNSFLFYRLKRISKDPLLSGIFFYVGIHNLECNGTYNSLKVLLHFTVYKLRPFLPHKIKGIKTYQRNFQGRAVSG